MLICQRDIDGLNGYLLHMLRSGDQWVAYDKNNGGPDAGNALTFLNLNAAGRYCELHTSFYEPSPIECVFQPIHNAIETLAGSPSARRNNTDYKKLEEVIKQYSLSLHTKGCDIIEKLADGLYHPVAVTHTVLPWQDIEGYSVIELFPARKCAYEAGQLTTTHGGFTSYYDAQKCFQQLLEKYACRGVQPELNLIGQVKDPKPTLIADRFCLHEAGVLFKCATSGTYNSSGSQYEVAVMNAPDKPIDLVQQKIVKFDGQTSALEFFDGALRKVTANAKVQFMDDFYKFWSDLIGVDDDGQVCPTKIN